MEFLKDTRKGYYPNTKKAIRGAIKEKYPDAKTKEGIDNLPSHLLWMLREIDWMEDNPGKAGRWIGYVLRAVEEMGLSTNQASRDLVRKDVSEGYE